MVDNDIKIWNLDELEELNQAPARFILNGRELLMGSLPHQKYLAWYKRLADFQAAAQGLANGLMAGKADEEIKRLNEQSLGLLLDLFDPFTPWLREFDDEQHALRLAEWKRLNAADRAATPQPTYQRGVFFEDVPEKKLSYLLEKASDIQLDQERVANKIAGVKPDSDGPFEKILSPSLGEISTPT